MLGAAPPSPPPPNRGTGQPAPLPRDGDGHAAICRSTDKKSGCKETSPPRAPRRDGGSAAGNQSGIYKAARTRQHIRKSEATRSKTFLGANRSLFLENKLGAGKSHRSAGREKRLGVSGGKHICTPCPRCTAGGRGWTSRAEPPLRRQLRTSQSRQQSPPLPAGIPLRQGPRRTPRPGEGCFGPGRHAGLASPCKDPRKQPWYALPRQAAAAHGEQDPDRARRIHQHRAGGETEAGVEPSAPAPVAVTGPAPSRAPRPQPGTGICFPAAGPAWRWHEDHHHGDI